MLENLDHLDLPDLAVMASMVHSCDWTFHQMLEEPELKDWTYEFISGKTTAPDAIAQFRPHGGLPQVQVFIIQQGDLVEVDISANQIQHMRAYVASNASDKQTLPPDLKKLDDVNPAKTENGGCLSMILVLVLVGSFLSATF